MSERKQLNVRISYKLHSLIDATGRPKQAVVSDALELYFDRDVQQDDSTGCAQQLAVKDQQIAELHVMLQTSITQPPPQLPMPRRKHWWRFWQKNP